MAGLEFLFGRFKAVTRDNAVGASPYLSARGSGMKPIRIALSVLALLISAVPLIPAAQADELLPQKDAEATADTSATTYALRYRFEPGQQLRYVTVQHATTVAVAGENRKLDQSEVEQRRIFSVDYVDKKTNVAQLSMQFEFVRMQIRTNDGEPVVFDTTMKDDDIPSIFRMTSDRLKGSAARYQLNTNGSVVRTNFATVFSDSKTPPVKKAADENFEIHSFLPPLPDHPIRIGESWNQSHTVKVRVTKDLNREIGILQSFRLTAVSDGIAVIALNSSITSPIRSPLIRGQLIQSTPKGTLHFDIAGGKLLRREMHFDQSVLNAIGENTMLNSFGDYREELTPVSSESPHTPAPLSAATDDSSNAITPVSATETSVEGASDSGVVQAVAAQPASESPAGGESSVPEDDGSPSAP